MALKIWRFVTVMLAALTLGMGFCHVMEMPARLAWDQSLWVETTVRGGLYAMFGTLGAAIVVGAVIATAVLAWMVRGRGAGVFVPGLAAAVLFLLALAGWWALVFPVNLELAGWWALVFPVNLELAGWVDGPVPEDWDRYRMRWETGHAVNTLIQFCGFAALILSLLAETPGRSGRRKG